MDFSGQPPSFAAFPSNWTLPDDIPPPRTAAFAVQEERVSSSMAYPYDWSLPGSEMQAQVQPTASLVRRQDAADVPDASFPIVLGQAWPLQPSESPAEGRTYAVYGWAPPDPFLTRAAGMVPQHVLPGTRHIRRHQSSQSPMSVSSAASVSVGAVPGNYAMPRDDILTGYRASPLSARGSDSSPLPASELVRHVAGYYPGNISPASAATSTSSSQMLPSAVRLPRPAGVAFGNTSPHSVITGRRSSSSRNSGSDRHESPVLQSFYRPPRPAGYRLHDTTPPIRYSVPERIANFSYLGGYQNYHPPVPPVPPFPFNATAELVAERSIDWSAVESDPTYVESPREYLGYGAAQWQSRN